jgi:hypothetical protein
MKVKIFKNKSNNQFFLCIPKKKIPKGKIPKEAEVNISEYW